MESTSFFDQLLHSLTFPFKDRDWVKKTAIGFGLVLAMYIIPIIPILLIAGYGKRIMKRIILENGDPYLPEWDNWGNLLSDGLKLWGAGIIYSLPILLLLLIALTLMMVSILSPLFFIHSDGTMAPGSSLLIFAGMGIAFIVMFLMALLSLCISLVQAPALGHLVTKDSFSAAFSIKEWWPILVKGFNAFLVATLATMILSWVSMMIIQILNMTIILIVLFPFLIGLYTFFLMLYSYTFNALAYREGVRKLAA